MQQIVRVRRLLDEHTAEVVRVRGSACAGDCHKCSGCDTVQEMLIFQAENPIHAKAGELVTVRSAGARALKAAAVLYLLPLVLFFAGYLIGAAAGNRATAVGCISFAFGIALAIVYDRKVLRYQKNVYTITGYPTASMWESYTKGDDDLD